MNSIVLYISRLAHYHQFTLVSRYIHGKVPCFRRFHTERSTLADIVHFNMINGGMSSIFTDVPIIIIYHLNSNHFVHILFNEFEYAVEYFIFSIEIAFIESELLSKQSA